MNTKDPLRDWADIRVFLAIVDHGSLLAAAERLSSSQPTLGRRLAAMEERLDVSLFVRTGRRMQLTDMGRTILENARRMEREMLAIERAVDAQSKGLAGEVVVTATEGTGTEWLAPELYDFHQRYPEIVLNIHVDNRALDLLRREADIALRLGQPKDPQLIAKRLVTVGFGLYATQGYIDRSPPIRSIEDLREHNFIGLYDRDGSPQLALGNYLAINFTPHMVVVTNSPSAQISAARAGFGLAVLSHRWVSMRGDLVPVLPQITVQEMDLWLVTHEELRHSARIRAVSDYLSERVLASKEQFLGRP